MDEGMIRPSNAGNVIDELLDVELRNQAEPKEHRREDGGGAQKKEESVTRDTHQRVPLRTAERLSEVEALKLCAFKRPQHFTGNSPVIWKGR